MGMIHDFVMVKKSSSTKLAATEMFFKPTSFDNCLKVYWSKEVVNG